MSDNEQIKKYMSQLVGYAYPAAEPVENSTERLQRRWMVRVRSHLPEQSALDETSLELRKRGIFEIDKEYAEHSAQERLDKSYPTISLIRIDDYHMVADIQFPAPHIAVGDAALVATWGTLRALDDKWQIDELEGIPKRFWFLL